LSIISELDYKPNILASTLASKKAATFATLLPRPPSKEGYWNKPFIGVRSASPIRQNLFQKRRKSSK